MAQVTIEVNGHPYVVGCEDGQEPHLRELAKLFDVQVRQVSSDVGQLGETRLFLMASLLMADDLYELNKGRQGGAPMPAPSDPKLGRRLGKLAQRAEEIALDLEHP